MMSFYDLTASQRTAFVTVAFLVLCMGVCVAFAVLQRRRRMPEALAPLCPLLSGAILILYAADLLTLRNRELQLPAAVRWFCEQPVLIPLLILAAVFAYDAYIIYNEWQYRKTTLTRSSVKEGMDKVSSGLCFYYGGGRVILLNRRMNGLCHAIVGRDLQNAELFWQILQSGQVLPSVSRLSGGEHPSFCLPDGSVWMFAHENLDGIHQLRATDITQLQAVTDELREKNEQLTALNLRLRQYGENVDALSRSEERLEIKARIHRKLGQTLLATRRYLQEEDCELSAPLEAWQRHIAVLRREAQLQEEEKPLEMLTRVAAATGIALAISGEMPGDEDVKRLFVHAAAENLTNAISHAGAKTLFISLRQNDNAYTARFRNDGAPPKGEIIEGGGLGSLRRKIERAGGEMTVTGTPEFVLTVTLPKERGDRV